jgi:hypothetical protein
MLARLLTARQSDRSLNLPRRFVLTVLSFALFAAAAPAAGADALPGAHVSAAPQDIAKPADYPGIQHLHFKYGPIKISPGQNTIEARRNTERPSVPGFITRF